MRKTAWCVLLTLCCIVPTHQAAADSPPEELRKLLRIIDVPIVMKPSEEVTVMSCGPYFVLAYDTACAHDPRIVYFHEKAGEKGVFTRGIVSRSLVRVEIVNGAGEPAVEYQRAGSRHLLYVHISRENYEEAMCLPPVARENSQTMFARR